MIKITKQQDNLKILNECQAGDLLLLEDNKYILVILSNFYMSDDLVYKDKCFVIVSGGHDIRLVENTLLKLRKGELTVTENMGQVREIIV